MAPVLPPVGSEIFRRFTPASLEEIQRRHEEEEKEHQRRKEKNVEVQNSLICFKMTVINRVRANL